MFRSRTSHDHAKRKALFVVLILLSTLAGLPVGAQTEVPANAPTTEPVATEDPAGSTDPAEDDSAKPESGESNLPAAKQVPTLEPGSGTFPSVPPTTEQPASTTIDPTLAATIEETVVPPPTGTTITEPPLAAITASAMAFSNFQITPPTVCEFGQSVGLSIDVSNPDPTFQGIRIRLFGVALADDNEVQQNSVNIPSSKGAGTMTTALSGDFSATFRAWFMTATLLNAVGQSVQQETIPFTLPCAPGSGATGAMAFANATITPPDECVIDGIVNVQVEIISPDASFQGVRIELFGTTLIGETEISQDARLIAPGEGAGLFQFDLVGDFSETFRGWSVTFRLLDATGTSQQLDVKTIALDCAPIPSKSTETPISTATVTPEPVELDFGTPSLRAITSCIDGETLFGEITVNTPIAANQEIRLELFGFHTGEPTEFLIDTTTIGGPNPAETYQFNLFGDFSERFATWSLRASAVPAGLVIDLPVVPECLVTPSETPIATATATPDETATATATIIAEETATTTATVEPDADITFVVDAPVCGNNQVLNGTITVTNAPETLQGFLIVVTGIDAQGNEVVLDTVQLPAGAGDSVTPFTVTVDIGPEVTRFRITISLLLPRGLVRLVELDEIALDCSEPDVTPTEPDATPTEPEASPTQPVATETATAEVETPVTEPTSPTYEPDATPTGPVASPTDDPGIPATTPPQVKAHYQVSINPESGVVQALPVTGAGDQPTTQTPASMFVVLTSLAGVTLALAVRLRPTTRQ